MKEFFAELKRRNVYKVAVAYAVIAWLLVQVASVLFSTFEAPSWVMKVFIAFVALGFPIALVLAWAFELTPDGIQLTSPSPDGTRSRQPVWGRWFLSLIGLGIVGALALSFFLLPRRPNAQSQERALAVLPFENLSEDKANAYFADGMQDEIITRLAKIGELKVISRMSTLPYRARPEKISEIARQLAVGHIVQGTVQRVGDRIRINVQLIDAQTDHHLWAERYDRNLSDIFAVQTEVATEIAKALRAKLSPAEQSAVASKPTENMAAYDAYLRGIDFVSRAGETERNRLDAIAAFEEAVGLDPKFAVAWAALAQAHASLYFQQHDSTPARKEAARQAAETATRLAPAGAETLLANAYYRYHIERDYAGARGLFEQMKQQMPSSGEATVALARIARRQSRWRESLRLFEAAATLNPRDAGLHMDWAWTLSMLRRHRETLDLINRALAIKPGDADILVNKAMALQVTGDLAGARHVLENDATQAADGLVTARLRQLLFERNFAEAARLLEESLAAAGSQVTTGSEWQRQWLGYTRLNLGNLAAAREAFDQAAKNLERLQAEQPENHFASSYLAMAEAGRGNKEGALRAAKEAAAMRSAKDDPVYGPIAEEFLAMAETQTGEHERALSRIERLLTMPYGPFPLTQPSLRLDPIWDPLRQHPRFKALVDEPEPKTIYQ